MNKKNNNMGGFWGGFIIGILLAQSIYFLVSTISPEVNCIIQGEMQ